MKSSSVIFISVTSVTSLNSVNLHLPAPAPDVRSIKLMADSKNDRDDE